MLRALCSNGAAAIIGGDALIGDDTRLISAGPLVPYLIDGVWEAAQDIKAFSLPPLIRLLNGAASFWCRGWYSNI